jgi:hypothetical protein
MVCLVSFVDGSEKRDKPDQPNKPEKSNGWSLAGGGSERYAVDQ